MVALLVDVADAAEVDFADAALVEPLYCLLHVVLLQFPEVGEVVHHSIRNDAQCYLVTMLLVDLH